MCEESDIQSVFTDLSLANSILSGTCRIEIPPVPIIPAGEETLLTGKLACFSLSSLNIFQINFLKKIFLE